jgi:Tol biopolymer transport system component
VFLGITPSTPFASHIVDYPWTGPPAIKVSEWKNQPKFGYHTANSVGADGRFVAFYRIRRDGPARLLLHNVERNRNRVVSRPHEGYRECFDCGRFPSFGGTRLPDFSTDGRYLVFTTDYRLVDLDRNRYADVYRYDIKTREYVLVSVGADGKPGNSPSSAASISDDGRYVAFDSPSSDLVADDTNEAGDVFVRDLVEDTTTRVSVSSDGSQGEWTPTEDPDVRYVRGNSHTPDISGDGALVAFVSIADTLVEGDTNDANDVFVHDLRDHTTRRVSVTSSGEQLEPFEYCESASCFRDGAEQAAISGDGRVVVFQSHANDLVPEDQNQNVDIFTHELATGITERVSEPTGGGEAYGPGTHSCGHNGQCFFSIWSSAPSISYDADRIFFFSGAPGMTHVDDGERGSDEDVFVHDRSTKVTQLVNRTPDGEWAPGANIYEGQISSDGKWVTYSSDARGIVPGDRLFGDVFLQRLDDAAFGD